MFVFNLFIFKKLLIMVTQADTSSARCEVITDSRQQTTDSRQRRQTINTESVVCSGRLAYGVYLMALLYSWPDPWPCLSSNLHWWLPHQRARSMSRLSAKAMKSWTKMVLRMGEVVVRETFCAVSLGGFRYLHWSFHRRDRTKIPHSEVFGNRTRDLSTIETRYRSEITLFRHGEVNWRLKRR